MRFAAISSASWFGTIRMDREAFAFLEIVVVADLLDPGTSMEWIVSDGSRQRCMSELTRASGSAISGCRGRRTSAMAA